jgi:hypothetical protein
MQFSSKSRSLAQGDGYLITEIEITSARWSCTQGGLAIISARWSCTQGGLAIISARCSFAQGDGAQLR